eukprot:1985148-Prymnesium_polylepis.1
MAGSPPLPAPVLPPPGARWQHAQPQRSYSKLALRPAERDAPAGGRAGSPSAVRACARWARPSSSLLLPPPPSPPAPLQGTRASRASAAPSHAVAVPPRRTTDSDLDSWRPPRCTSGRCTSYSTTVCSRRPAAAPLSPAASP